MSATKMRAAPAVPGEQAGSATNAAPEVAKRLVVDLTRRAAGDLGWLVDAEELNKTTIVNRAIQVYKMILEAQQSGQQIVIEDPATDSRNRLIIV